MDYSLRFFTSITKLISNHCTQRPCCATETDYCPFETIKSNLNSNFDNNTLQFTYRKKPTKRVAIMLYTSFELAAVTKEIDPCWSFYF